MKKILSLLSFLMLAVVAMAADLTTGVTFKGTWGDKLGDYPTAEGEMTVTKVDEGLKFEVKSNGFNGYAFPAYTLVYKSEVAADGSFNTGDYFIGEITGDPTMDGLPVANLYWQQIKGTVTNESIDLYIRYMGVNMTELEHITFKGEAVASPDPEPTVVSTKDFTDTFTMSYIENGELQSSSFKDFPASFVEMSDGTFNVEFPEVNHKFTALLQKYDPATERTYYEGTYTENDGMQVYNFDVTAYLYTKDDVEHIYFIAKSDNADQLTYAYGSDPFAEPVVEDVVLKENYQADGTGFSFTTPIDWETQKFQAVLDVTGCSTSAVEDIFGLGPDVSQFSRNIHVYSEQNSTFKAYYDCSNGNNNTTVSIADKQNVTIEVSKADGLVIDGNVIIPAANLEGFFDLTEVMFGSLENSQFTNALYKSIKLINLNKKEEPVFVTYTAPAMYTYASMDEETPGAKRFVEAQEIQLSDNGDGTYTVIIKNLGDSEGDPAGDIQFTATATEAEDGTISLTADTQVELGGYYEGSGEYAVKFNGTLNGENLTATYDIDIPSGAAHAEFGNGVTNGINTVNNTNNTITSIYTVGGAKVNSLQKGVNIVRLANGKTVKVIK